MEGKGAEVPAASPTSVHADNNIARSLEETAARAARVELVAGAEGSYKLAVKARLPMAWQPFVEIDPLSFAVIAMRPSAGMELNLVATASSSAEIA